MPFNRASASNLTFDPTTTLSALTSNNTSAASSLASPANGNLGTANISKVDLHTLLYPGTSTNTYAHMVLWFGDPRHVDVSYQSNDPLQIKRQITDMISRGTNGVILVWYGPNNIIDQAAQLVGKEVEAHPGFGFAIMIDAGALR